MKSWGPSGWGELGGWGEGWEQVHCITLCTGINIFKVFEPFECLSHSKLLDYKYFVNYVSKKLEKKYYTKTVFKIFEDLSDCKVGNGPAVGQMTELKRRNWVTSGETIAVAQERRWGLDHGGGSGDRTEKTEEMSGSRTNGTG